MVEKGPKYGGYKGAKMPEVPREERKRMKKNAEEDAREREKAIHSAFREHHKGIKRAEEKRNK